LIHRFVMEPFKHRMTHPSGAPVIAAVAPSVEPSSAEEAVGLSVAETEDCCTHYIRGLLRDELAQEMFGFVQAVQLGHAWPPETRDGLAPVQVRDVFPRLPGASLTMRDAALEWVKQIMHVLSLETSISDEVRRIRESLLRILSVPSFSPIAAFVSPSANIILPDLCCRFCNNYEDVDLGQLANNIVINEEIQKATEEQDREMGSGSKLTYSQRQRRGRPERDREEESEDQANGEEENKIRDLCCQCCAAIFSRAELDDMMCRMIVTAHSEQQVEDQVCVQCGAMKDRYLAERCSCGGRWRSMSEGVDSKSQARRWPAMLRLCTFFGFEHSKAMLDFLCQADGIIVDKTF